MNAMEDPDTEIAQANGESVASTLALAIGLTQVQDNTEIKTYLLKPIVMLQATIVEIIE